MSWWDRLFRHDGPRVTGFPTSSNRASSTHLVWAIAADDPLVEVSAVLEILTPPTISHLYFWALQASFAGGGAAHLGLQWGADQHRPGPSHANWGGYASGGSELTGTASGLPSSTGNANTRDYPWQPGRPYRLRIARGTSGWLGEVIDVTTGVATVIRELDGPGGSLTNPVVWAEVFARCDDPPVAARWSELAGLTAGGSRVLASSVRTSYQTRSDGGCDNTSAAPDGAGFVLSTATARVTPPGTDLSTG